MLIKQINERHKQKTINKKGDKKAKQVKRHISPKAP